MGGPPSPPAALDRVVGEQALGAAVGLWAAILVGEPATGGSDEFLRADALSTLLALCVSFVTALAAWLGPGLARDEAWDPVQARRFRVFANLFAFTMLFAVTTNNVGFMWVAIEATTITSAVLIPLTVTKPSVEASLLCLEAGPAAPSLQNRRPPAGPGRPSPHP